MVIKPHILVIDEDEQNRAQLTQTLKDAGNQVSSVSYFKTGFDKASPGKQDVIVLGVNAQQGNLGDALSKLRSKVAEVPIVVIANDASIELAVDTMKQGAFDFLRKPVDPERVQKVIQAALALSTFHKSLLSKKKKGTEKPDTVSDVVQMMGQSEAMDQIFKLIERAAEGDVTVLIQGESGTGKELAARAIHRLSPRKNKVFIAVNCAAIPETLLESELFGHEAGAFTGAIKKTKGKFEQAEGGTIFLDEVGEMSLATQVKILRILQEREFERVGGTESIKANVRVISSTNKDLNKTTKAGTFREDLFYRLSVFPVWMPPLRNRRDDIPTLVGHFLQLYNKKTNKKIKEVSPEVMELLLNYGWPGNVRELENVVERATVLCQGVVIEAEHIPSGILEAASQQSKKKVIFPSAEVTGDEVRPLREEERRILQRAFEILGGNISLVAKQLEISRRTLYRKIKEFGIDTP